MKALLGIQTAVLLLALLGLGVLSARVSALETRLDEATATQRGPDLAVQLPRQRPPRDARSPRSPRMRMPLQADGSEAVIEAKVEDQLWSEQGRAAIDDVVEERDQRAQEKRSERWRKMGEVRRERLVEELTEELDLDEVTADAVLSALTTAGEARGELWRKMRGDEDVDPASLVDAREAIKAQLEADLTEAIGEEAARSTLARMRGPF